MAQVEAVQPANPAPRDPGKIFPVSWDQFHRDLRALAWRLSGAGPFEAIVCITRGGLVPAAIVARELGIKLIETICVSSYTGTSQGDLTVLKNVAAGIIALGGGQGARVLLVDDLVDTGKTRQWLSPPRIRRSRSCGCSTPRNCPPSSSPTSAAGAAAAAP